MSQRLPLGFVLRRAVIAVIALTLAACGDPEMIGGDATIRLVDAGPPDAGQDFPEGGIGRDGLEIVRVVPDHGPFVGGNTVILRGNGFTDESFVSFGEHSVQPADHRLIDARRLSVVVPAGDVGIVDVSIRVGTEEFVLQDGYTYDAIYVTPNSGSVAGGTLIEITGSGTSFEDGDTVLVGRTNCSDVTVVSEARITCRTPASAAGSVDVTVVDGADDSEVVAADAFNYFDSSDPNSGGLGGGPIEGSINITVIDGMTGLAVPDAYAVLGQDLTTEHQGLTDSLGQITFSGPDVLPPATIHVAKHCYEKTSFVTFDARDVTIFLNPWMDPMCGDGEPGGTVGRGRNGAFIEGELIWLGPNEMGPNPWLNVPEERTGWTRVAYVYTTSASVTSQNPDPAAGGSLHRVLEDNTGLLGYPYSIFARPSGLAVYALAGLEHTVDGRFIPYVMGVARNVLAGPGETVSGVDVVMNIPLDHFVEAELTELPNEVQRGPDRFSLRADIDLGGEGFIVRNVNGNALDELRSRDASRSFRFVAQPALSGTLADGRYRIEAGWYTGALDDTPYTMGVETGVTAVDDTVTFGGFLGIPVPVTPAYGERIPIDRILRWRADGPPADLHMILIFGADGNSQWTMFVPGDVYEAPVPNLSEIEGIDDIPTGQVVWGVFAISIPAFDFNQFRYEYLSSRYWRRSALDVFLAQR